jgi:hypothetical protein
MKNKSQVDYFHIGVNQLSTMREADLPKEEKLSIHISERQDLTDVCVVL